MDYKKRLELLIGKGYLPNELIPPFNSTDLSKILFKDIIPNLGNFKIKSSEYTKHSIPKHKRLRRQLGIPNPLHQIMLCHLISEKWEELEQNFKKSNLSLSKPFFKEDLKRALARTVEMSDLSVERILRSTNSRYLLHADITSYYSSIYTHSISWALHTKSVAKASMNSKGLKLLGDLLDTRLRNTQDKQTLGIPIGPDSSLVISEIIGVVLDNEVQKRIKIKNGFRFIDDYFLYFDSLSDAEEALTEINSILIDFELELNVAKTKIIVLPESLEPHWVSELSLFNVDAKNQKRQIISYFSRAFELAKLYPEEYVLLYTINRFTNFNISKENWDIVESFILQIILVEPEAIEIAIELFLRYYEEEFEIDFEKNKNCVFEMIIYHSKHSHGKELAWSLWLCKVLNIKIPDVIAFKLKDVNDSIVALIALDLRNKSLFEKKLDVSNWKRMMSQDNLYSEHWILSYEASVHGWLRSTDDYISRDLFFSTLKEKKVRFYDDSKGVTIKDIDVNRNGESDQFTEMLKRLGRIKPSYRSIDASGAH